MDSEEFAAMVIRRHPTEEECKIALKKLETDAAIQFSIGRVLSVMKTVAHDFNVLKRCLFYGKIEEPDRQSIDRRYDYAKAHAGHDDSSFKDRLKLGKSVTSDTLHMVLFHVVAGIGSELGELTEALESTCSGKHDSLNWSEELGDIDWYRTLGLVYNDTTTEAVWNLIDAKLEKRHKGKCFNASATVNRDVKEEREVMENVKKS